MDSSYDEPDAVSVADSAAGSVAGSAIGSAGSVLDADVASVHGSAAEEAPAGVLSGVGPNPEAAQKVARDKGWTDPVPFEYAELANSKDHRDWAGVAARYEWQDDYGDVGPAVPELEDQLFHGELITRAGAKLDE